MPEPLDLDKLERKVKRATVSTFPMETSGIKTSYVADLIAELREARATIERIRALHKRSHAVFSWRDGLRFEDPCPDCDGKAGVHECGCWADSDAEFVCSECTGGKGAPVAWPCPTIQALNEGRERCKAPTGQLSA